VAAIKAAFSTSSEPNVPHSGGFMLPRQ
jgi:hypothetical protein